MSDKAGCLPSIEATGVNPMGRLLLALLLFSSPALAATHYVWCGAGGAATGADWTNAYRDLPGTTPRGDTYVVAGSGSCTYATHDFTTAVSGTNVVTVRHARAASDSGVAGWQASFGTAQAKWASARWIFRTSYFTMDGTSDTAGQQGFLLDTDLTLDANQLSCCFIFVGNGDATNTHIRFRYVEINGHKCCAVANRTDGTNAVGSGSGRKDAISFSHVYFHDITGSPFDLGNTWTNVIIEYSHMARNRSSSAQHSEGISAKPVSHLIDRYNLWENIAGTGIWVCLTGNCDDWQIYGDVVVNYNGVAPCAKYDGHPEASCGHGSGILVTNTPGFTLSNLKFYNNSIINVVGGSNCGLKAIKGTHALNWEIQNNFWYNCGSSTVSITGPRSATCSSNCTHDYNNFWKVRVEAGTTVEAHESNITSRAPDLFAGIARKDFHLTRDTSAWKPLGSPYNTDPDGVPRTSSRGAFQFTGGARPQPASRRRVTISATMPKLGDNIPSAKPAAATGSAH